MISLLVDSNTVLRTLKALTASGEDLFVTPQNVVEVWVVATRPEAYSGLGMSVDQAIAETARLKNLFNFIADTAAIHPLWETIVIQHRVLGKPAHDARLVAAMQAHGIKLVDPVEVVLPTLERKRNG